MEFLAELDQWREAAPQTSAAITRKSLSRPAGDVLRSLELERNRRSFLRFLKERTRIADPAKMIESFRLLGVIEQDPQLVSFVVEREHKDILHNYLICIVIFLRFCLNVHQHVLYKKEMDKAQAVLWRLEAYHKTSDAFALCRDCVHFKKHLAHVSRNFVGETAECGEVDRLRADMKKLTAQPRASLHKAHYQDLRRLVRSLERDIASLPVKIDLFVGEFLPLVASLMTCSSPKEEAKSLRRCLKAMRRFLPASPFTAVLNATFEGQSGANEFRSTSTPPHSYPFTLVVEVQCEYLSNQHMESILAFLVAAFEGRTDVVDQTTWNILLDFLCTIVNNWKEPAEDITKACVTVSRLFCLAVDHSKNEIHAQDLDIICQAAHKLKRHLANMSQCEAVDAALKALAARRPAESLPHVASSLLRWNPDVHPMERVTILPGDFHKHTFYFSEEQLATATLVICFSLKVKKHDIKLGIFRSSGDYTMSARRLAKENQGVAILDKTFVTAGTPFRGVLEVTSPGLLHFVYDNSYSIITQKELRVAIHVLRSHQRPTPICDSRISI